MPSTAVSASLLLVHMRCGAGSNAQNPLEVGTCCRELATQFLGESCTPTVSVCVCSDVQSCLTLYNPMNCTTPGFPVLHYLLELGQTHVHWIGDAIQPSHPYHPLLLPPSVFPSIRVFSNESALHIRWPNYWSFSFSISPSSECSGLISFRIEWLDLLADQGTLKSLIQHHSLKASILWHLAFFMVQLTSICDYWKNHSVHYMDICLQSDVSAF